MSGLRLAIKLAAAWIALLLAVVGGGFVNATLGTAGVAVYGVVVGGLVLLAISDVRHRSRAR